MLSLGMIAFAAVAVPIGIGISHAARAARRRKLMHQPAPPEWEDVLQKNVALYRYLPEDLRSELHGHMHNFLREKHFEGCGGLELTEEMKVTIAGQACILLLNKDRSSYFPKCDAILVYPSAYLADQRVDMGSHTIQQKSARLGESWTRGVVVLAWDHVTQRALDVEGGHNVVLHEFAHQLDQEDGAGDGTPILAKATSYASWARIFGKEYEHLRHKAMQGMRDVMDLYGATNPAEFFAVATETFFEKGAALRQKHPDLYEQLKEYYRMDPAHWVEKR
jgi:Mlc titration factor MtfA (ptsG expression regulator)